MNLFLQPNDTFFFRDGRPFTKGEQSEGHSIFPPLPSTVLGALRSAYIAEYGDLRLFYSGKMSDVIGTPTSLCNAIRLRGVFLANSRKDQLEMFLPVPLDLVYRENERKPDNIPLHLLTPNESKNFASNGTMSNPLSWSTSESVDADADGLLRLGSIRRYLQGIGGLKLTDRATLVEPEPKSVSPEVASLCHLKITCCIASTCPDSKTAMEITVLS